MWKNYVLTSIRALSRQWGFALTIVGGFALGLGCCLLILLHLSHELNYDAWHEDADRLYRVMSRSSTQGIEANVGVGMGALGPTMLRTIPEVDLYCRVRSMFNARITLRNDDNVVFRDQGALVDSTFLEMFDFGLDYGDRTRVLRRRGTVVISRNVADALFPGENPVGRTLQINIGLGGVQELEVDGVLEAPTFDRPSHLRLDVILPMAHLQYGPNAVHHDNNWRTANTSTYVRVVPGSSKQAVFEQTAAIYAEFDQLNNRGPYLVDLADNHLDLVDATYDLNYNKSDRSHVQILTVVAVIVLVIAVFNFVNLSAARSLRRIREVGLRKTLGASKGQLMAQFMLEGMLLCFGGAVIALMLVEIALPFTGIPLDRLFVSWLFVEPTRMAALIAVVALIGCVSAYYPAKMLASISEAQATKGSLGSGAGNVTMRRALVGVQFGLSILLVFGSLVVRNQLLYMIESDAGYDAQKVVRVRLTSPDSRTQYRAIRDALLADPRIAAAGSANVLPGETFGRFRVQAEGAGEDESMLANGMYIDDSADEVLGLRLLAGRTFEPTSADTANAMVVNEAMVLALGYSDPVGRTVEFPGANASRTIIGVVKDFHHASLRLAIEPTFFLFAGFAQPNMLVRFSEGISDSEGIEAVSSIWGRMVPDTPLTYAFHGEELREMYKNEYQLLRLILGFTGLAIVVACVGLVGLIGFMAQQRIREIGIRKVLGASTASLAALLCREAMLIVLVAGAVAAPVGWILAQSWIEQFSFQVPLKPVWLLIPMGIVMFASLASLLRIVWKAADTNPVHALRSE